MRKQFLSSYSSYLFSVFCMGGSKGLTVLYAIKCQQVVIELWLGSYRMIE